MSKQITQISLSHRYDDTHYVGTTTWVEWDKRLKKGVHIILKDDHREWTITDVWGQQEMSEIDNCIWDNKEVSYE